MRLFLGVPLGPFGLFSGLFVRDLDIQTRVLVRLRCVLELLKRILILNKILTIVDIGLMILILSQLIFHLWNRCSHRVCSLRESNWSRYSFVYSILNLVLTACWLRPSLFGVFQLSCFNQFSTLFRLIGNYIDRIRSLLLTHSYNLKT